MASYFPDQGLNPCPLQWKHGVLTRGSPGKSLGLMLLQNFPTIEAIQKQKGLTEEVMSSLPLKRVPLSRMIRREVLRKCE